MEKVNIAFKYIEMIFIVLSVSLFSIFLPLKLLGYISWSWLSVFMPLWGLVLLWSVLFLLMMVIGAYLSSIRENEWKKLKL